LDFDLVNLVFVILGLHIDDAQFIVEEFLVIIGVKDLNRGNRGA